MLILRHIFIILHSNSVTGYRKAYMKMEYPYPKSFARFYDLIYNSMRDSVDHDFFLRKIMQTRGKVLEVGVGTGRLFLDALNKGADIYGIDISPAMMEVLRQKIGKMEQYRVGLANIVDFSHDITFDLIIAPFRVLMHLLDKEDQIAALNNTGRRQCRCGHRTGIDASGNNPDRRLRRRSGNPQYLQGEFYRTLLRSGGYLRCRQHLSKSYFRDIIP